MQCPLAKRNNNSLEITPFLMEVKLGIIVNACRSLYKSVRFLFYLLETFRIFQLGIFIYNKKLENEIDDP